MTVHSPTDQQWPLVGRDSELARVLAYAKGAQRGVVLAGPAGAGKTRLARECLEGIEAFGYRPLRVTGAKATAALPLGAFAALLPDMDPNFKWGDMLRHVARSVGDAGDGAPVALLVDDAHLLDETSAALAHQLAASRGTFVIATVRSREAAPEQIASLWRDGLMARIDLAPLNLSGVSALLEAALGGLIESVTARTLSERSGGNLLFLRELVIEALRTDVLVEEYGIWRLRAQLPPSDRLIELVEYRLRALSTGGARKGLDVLAVAESLDLAVFKRLTSEDAVLELEEAGLIRIDRAGSGSTARLAHPLYGEVVRASLASERARSISRSLADAAEELSGIVSPDDLLRLVNWRLDGGGEFEPNLMLAAAHRARALHDFPLAERLVRAAVDAGAPFEAELLLGQVLSLKGCPEDAERVFARLTGRVHSDTERGQTAIARIDNLCYSLGRLEEALTVASEAASLIAEERWRDEIAAYRAAIVDAQGDIAGALRVAAPLVERSHGKAAVWAKFMTSWGAARTGQISKAMTVAEEAYTAHDALLARSSESLPWGPRTHACVRGFALVFGGRLLAAEDLLRAEYEASVEERETEDQWVTAGTLAAIYCAQGRVMTAQRYGRECVSLSRDHGRLMIMRIGLISLAEALALAGRGNDAEAALADLVPPRAPDVGFLRTQFLRASAWAAVANGNMREGRKLLGRAIDSAAASGDVVWEATALHDLARLGEPASVEARLCELAQRIEGPFGAARAVHAQALASKDVERLEAVSKSFERMGAILLAAEAAADGAVVHRRRGRPRDANRAQLRAAKLAGQCEGAITPSLATTPAARAILSGRELEIARAAAVGHSNKEIARQFCLSVRTVENKLQDAYGKLGVSGRDQLAVALGGTAAVAVAHAGLAPMR
jgi:DNA-binding CsgD family transcriptional regulator/tetratricopeptide (TPR) repeat protein